MYILLCCESTRFSKSELLPVRKRPDPCCLLTPRPWCREYLGRRPPLARRNPGQGAPAQTAGVVLMRKACPLGMLPVPWGLSGSVTWYPIVTVSDRGVRFLEQLCGSWCFVGVNPWRALSAVLIFLWNLEHENESCWIPASLDNWIAKLHRLKVHTGAGPWCIHY